MRTTPTIAAIAPALVKALSEIEGASKDAANDAFKKNNKGTKYATLDAVISASRETLAKHGLALMQWPGHLEGGTLSLETVILHESGEWVSGDFQIALGKVDPQGVGSALTYARRYAQKAALNIPDLDDDGEAAMDRNAPKRASAVEMAVNLLKGCGNASMLKDAWSKNAKAWNDLLSDDDWNKVVAVKNEQVEHWKAEFARTQAEKPEGARKSAETRQREPAAAGVDPFDDEIPF